MMPTDSRVHPQPLHSAYPPPPGSGYPSQASHGIVHHHSSRHVSNGPPTPLGVSGPPPPMPMSGPTPPEALPPSTAPVNGHGHSVSVAPGMSQAARAGKEKQDSVFAQLAAANENTWMLIGAVSEQMNDQERALAAFENALRHNPNSILGLNAVASIARSRDNFDKAIEYFQRILNIKQDNGEVWGSMGHCLLMKDDLPKAYTAYQQALYYLPNPKEPKLWYGIGILYDRYGSFEHAEEAFSSVLKMDPNFEKANEIYFRLGIIYKHQRKYSHSLECFRYIINNPPRPLTSWDIWFQLGHVYELDQDYVSARDAYMRVLGHQPDHAKVLQQLGWLYHQPGAPFANQDQAVSYLTKSLETDGSDAQSWYLLGRAFMSGQRYNKAYEAYQQAVYREGRNPTFWCSIGVLYFQINQYRDALDAYSRAIRLNPYIPEVWYNLGSLYESCNNQITDAIDAYSRAAELDPSNPTTKQRLQMLQNAGSNNTPLPPAPGPVDVHPSQYSAPPGGSYAVNGSPSGSPRLPPAQTPTDSRDLNQAMGRDLPAPPAEFGRSNSPGPFRGGAAPPPLNHVDESRGAMSRHAPLAPIETDMPEPRDLRESYREGPAHNGAPTQALRYDPPNELSSRHAPSPSSPRRRTEAAPPPQGYSHYHSQPGYRDRDREEWERRERERRPIPPHDPRQPSPRLLDRGHSQVDPRQPSPRISSDQRDYPRNAEGYSSFGYDRGPPAVINYPSQYDIRREERRYDDRDRDFKPPAIDHPSNGQSLRQPSVAAVELRAPSPAASTSSKASVKRKVSDKRDDDRPTQTSAIKRSREEKSKKEKKDKRLNGEEISPRGTAASSPAASVPTSTPRQTPKQTPRETMPSRTVDEDYDEGAADALMFLHSDRRPSSSVPTSTTAMDRTSPALAVMGTKRTEPPSPTSSQINKKAKAGSLTPTPPAAAPSPGKRTVIEILNTPRIQSPVKADPPEVDDARSNDEAPVRENSLVKSVPSETNEPVDKASPVKSIVDTKEDVVLSKPITEGGITTPPNAGSSQLIQREPEPNANADAETEAEAATTGETKADTEVEKESSEVDK